MDEQVRAFIKASFDFYPADAVNFSLERNRQLYDNYASAFRCKRPDNISAVDSHTASSDGFSIATRTYKNTAIQPKQDQCVLYIHGGGMILGGLESHDDVCAEICDRLGVRVVSLDYRLAPEYRYPTQLNDVAAVYKGLINKGLTPIVCGDSAGANLAAALCHKAIRDDFTMPLAQILIYPGFFGNADLPSYQDRADAAMLTTREVLKYRDFYSPLDMEMPLDDPCFCPIAVGADFSKLPPAALFSADIDPLRDDAKIFADRLKSYQDVTYYNEEELVHGYLRARHTSERAARAFSRIIKAIESYLE